MNPFKASPSPADIAKDIVKRKEVTPVEKTQETVADHKHEWDLLSKTSAPQRRDITQFGHLDTNTIDRILFGVTVFLWECVMCKSLRKETVLGTDYTQLDELIDKADKYGPQYLQRTDGQTFVVMKYLPQAQSTIPMR